MTIQKVKAHNALDSLRDPNIRKMSIANMVADAAADALAWHNSSSLQELQDTEWKKKMAIIANRLATLESERRDSLPTDTTVDDV